MNLTTGCVYRGDVIYIVTDVDKTRSTDGAFKGWSIHPDGLQTLHVGEVLARISAHNQRWDTGRIHIDGVHWEEKTWSQDEFIAFRDHVAGLLEVKPSPREELETMIANVPIIIRNFRRVQADLDRESAAYAHFEGVIAEARQARTELEANLKTLKSSPPEMAPAAR